MVKDFVSLDMTLPYWVIGPQHFEETQFTHFKMIHSHVLMIHNEKYDQVHVQVCKFIVL